MQKLADITAVVLTLNPPGIRYRHRISALFMCEDELSRGAPFQARRRMRRACAGALGAIMHGASGQAREDDAKSVYGCT